MRRYSTTIVIVIAVVLAAILIVASSREMVVADSRLGDAAPAPPVDHRIAQDDPASGMVDTAEVVRSIPALERARVANPESLRIILNLGDAYLAARRYDDARAAYDDALAASPGHPNARVGLAMVWQARGDDERAAQLLERVLAVFPDHQQAQFNLALIRFSRQEVTAAREAWVKAAEIDPTSRLGQVSQDFVDLLSDGDGGDAAP